MLKEQIVSLLHSFFVYWQRLQLRISTRISEPMRQAFESKKNPETFIQMTTLGFTSALLCLSANTVLHCGVKKTPSMLLVFHYSPVKPNPKPNTTSLVT